ncbi:RNA ligase [Sediminicurvatus halobius]|uniref:RNA ligase n=1 Tax=Sediminicurvatus halobius TaxID=2182432 RepID=A0A2U2N5I0_9GAMM|nr:RNA ligase [Spiribacter halobius]PWG64352.1 RNA ligase [Spiribacter halobius]UEX79301.1 RNA ligase [Spiribacter halobius]
MDRNTLDEALARGKAERRRFESLEYVRFSDGFAGIARGTVQLPDGRLLPGYPSIGRIQSLARGLRRQYAGPFWAEEKIDGFNVRLVQHDGALYAFSRGGFVCPFSTDRLPDLLDPTVFESEPALILCAEIAGPENPYLEGSPPQVREDVALFVFDIIRGADGAFLEPPAKSALAARYGLPMARSFGRFTADDQQALGSILRQLDAEGSEGLVFKGEGGGGRTKYVTGRSNIADISLCSEQLLDLPPEYFTNRLLRLALFTDELGSADAPALERELGRAFLQGLERAVARSREVGRVGHRFRCRFRQRRNAEHFIAHLEATAGRRVHIAEGSPHREGDYWILEFERILQRMTGTLANVLAGQAQFD